MPAGRIASRRLAFLVVLLVAALAACSPAATPSKPASIGTPEIVELRHRQLPIPADDFSRLAWLPDGRLVLEIDPPEGSGFDQELWLYAEGKRLRTLPLKEGEDCIATGFADPTPLGDGRLGFTRRCSGKPPAGVRITLEALDLGTGKVSSLMSSPLGLTGTPTGGAMWGSEWTWNPSANSGMARIGILGCETIVWLSEDGVEYATITVTDPPYTWRLDDQFYANPGDCGSNGRAMAPAWSPAGDEIAFFGSAHAPDIDIWDVIDDPWNLYLMDASGQKPRIVLREVDPDVGLQWSPDGRFLAFTGTIAERRGLWVYSTEDGGVHGVDVKDLVLATWSPDGSQIASLRFHGEGLDASADVWIIDATGLTSTGSP